MADHYYTQTPQSAHKPGEVCYEDRCGTLLFSTDSGVFSRTKIDQGTEILLDALPNLEAGAVLDLGCGYGVIGVTMGKRAPLCSVTMSDVNERACGLAKENAERNGVKARILQSDGYASFGEERFDMIIQNPPIRAGKTVIYGMFAEGSRRLREDGSLWLVIRKQQGAASAMTYLESLFQEVAAVSKKAGYWVIRCTKPNGTKGEINQ
ncbi:MAG: methyltransferase [Eubacteriales bacterium]|nr:methyltransferase [Eubacteriales bacterium]